MNTKTIDQLTKDVEQTARALSEAQADVTAKRDAYARSRSDKDGKAFTAAKDAAELAEVAASGARGALEEARAAAARAEREAALAALDKDSAGLSASGFLASIASEFGELLEAERKIVTLRAAITAKARETDRRREGIAGRARKLAVAEPPRVPYEATAFAELERAHGTPDSLTFALLTGLDGGDTGKLDAFLSGVSPAPATAGGTWDRWDARRRDVLARLNRTDDYMVSLGRLDVNHPERVRKMPLLAAESAAIRRCLASLPMPEAQAAPTETKAELRARFSRRTAA